MKVLMVASEAAPFAKTGGLADVLGGLPPALVRRGVDVAVVIPKYTGIRVEGAERVWENLVIWLGPYAYNTHIEQVARRGVTYYFVDCPGLYGRDGLYGDRYGDYRDNHIRFGVLSHAAIAIARRLFRPGIVHCHDWQAALVPVFLRQYFSGDPTFHNVRTVFSIHNLGYQGNFPPRLLAEMGLDGRVMHIDGMEFYGNVSLLKGGITSSDRLTTVSPTYAREIQHWEYGFGMDGLLRARNHVLTGILNGVDYDEWNPETDPHIPAHYSAADMSGKRLAKKALLEEAGLHEADLDRPLVGVVSRFVHQKGFDLVAEIVGALEEEDMYLVALGSGDYEWVFRRLAAVHPDRVWAYYGYNNPLAHRIEAGADLFLMPSRYEPCGLNQIFSLRYGTVPLVRATGGLNDTVEHDVTGFKFWEYSGQALLAALNHALGVYHDEVRWLEMVRAAMKQDFSWNVAAAEYVKLYEELAR